MNVKAMKENYLHTLKETKSPHTLKSYRSSLDKFVDWLGGTWDEIDDMGHITPSVVRDYKQYLETKHKPTTSNNGLIILKGFLEYGQKNGIDYVTNPIPAIKLKAIANQNDTKWLEREDIPKLFHAIDVMKRTNETRKTMYRAIVGVLVNCGLRVSEVTDLKTSDVDTKGGMLFIRSGKGDKFRTVPFGDKTAEMLREWLSVHNSSEYLFYSERSPQMTTRAVQHMIQRLSKDTGIEFTVHQLRHTFAKKYADTTGRIEAVASLLGHSHIQTTRRYIEPSMKELQAYMNEVES